MAECKKCEGLGTIYCQECTEESYRFFTGVICPSCAGMLIIPCSECLGTGKAPDKKK